MIQRKCWNNKISYLFFTYSSGAKNIRKFRNRKNILTAVEIKKIKVTAAEKLLCLTLTILMFPRFV